MVLILLAPAFLGLGCGGGSHQDDSTEVGSEEEGGEEVGGSGGDSGGRRTGPQGRIGRPRMAVGVGSVQMGSAKFQMSVTLSPFAGGAIQGGGFSSLTLPVSRNYALKGGS